MPLTDKQALYDAARQRFAYDPETGLFRYINPHPSANPGWFAGHRIGQDKRYLSIRVGRKYIPAHRLAFILMTGNCPSQIDHINCDPSDNRWSNLRPCTTYQNNVNQARPATAGTFEKAGKWGARMMVNGEMHYFGMFDTRDEARHAYIHVRMALHGEFNHETIKAEAAARGISETTSPDDQWPAVLERMKQLYGRTGITKRQLKPINHKWPKRVHAAPVG